MIIKFWGVRGSIPVPGKETVEFGGNTVCIEVLTADLKKLIFDAGTGIRLLGNELMEQEFAQGKGVLHIFFTNSHWDHIQGFPFFAPAYIGVKDNSGNHIENCCNSLHIYGMANQPEKTLRGQMVNSYFPVDLDYLSSKIQFRNIENNQIKIGDTLVSAIPLNKLNTVFGYRLEEFGKSVVIATNCRFKPDAPIDPDLLKLSRNADVLIYKSQSCCNEYPQYTCVAPDPGNKDFGNSIPVDGIKVAQEAEVKHLVITYHNPLHNDAILKEVEVAARKQFCRLDFAREGMNIQI